MLYTDASSRKPSPQTAENGKSSTPGRATGTRRRLSPEQQGEVVRMYRSTTTPVPDISKQFSIGESSVYRLVQLHGVAPRGRVGVSAADRTPPAGESVVAGNNTHKAIVRRGGTAADRGPARDHDRPAVVASGPTPSARAANPLIARTFRVSFVGVQIIQASDVNDAIRQANALGANDIASVERVG
jgi:transposase-like protein